MLKKTQIKFRKFSAVLALFALMAGLYPGGAWPAGRTAANAESGLCSSAVDTMIVLDVSGSMGAGLQSTCAWRIVERTGPSTFVQRNKTQNNLTESACGNICAQYAGNPSIVACNSIVFNLTHNTKWTDAKNAAKAYVEFMGQPDQSGLVSFSSSASLRKQLSNSHAGTLDAIDALPDPDGATNIGDAIKLAKDELVSERANPQAAKSIILLTDGVANKPNGNGFDEHPLDVVYAQQMADEAGAANIRIYTIGLDGDESELNEAMLESIAVATGGTYQYAPNSGELNLIYQEVIQRQCEKSSISGCKYSDAGLDYGIAGDGTLSGWEIVLSGDANRTQMTDSNGCYSFSDLNAGNYTVSEGANDSLKPFTQTYPADSSYEIVLGLEEHRTEINFGNYIPMCGNGRIDQEISEECDDGSQNGLNDACTIECKVYVPTECEDGQTEQCGTDAGACEFGTRTCAQGVWGECAGAIGPADEICDDQIDNDCDGLADLEDAQDCGNFVCRAGDTRPCYEGLTGTAGVGLCHAGVETCADNSWGVCAGQVLPAEEICDQADNNCDSGIDEGLECGDNGTRPSGTINACKYNDEDRNGQFDPEIDRKIAWGFRLVALVEGSEVPIIFEARATSSAETCAVFTDLPVGDYRVIEDGRERWLSLSPASGSLDASITEEAVEQTLNFLNMEIIGNDGNDEQKDDNPSNSGGGLRYVGGATGFAVETPAPQIPDQPIVLGEEGTPELTIMKTAKEKFINIGDIVNYTVTVKNEGNIPAVGVKLTDVLPVGLEFTETKMSQRTWELGDIEAGGERVVSYSAQALIEAKPGLLRNIATVVALNNDPVSVFSDVELKPVAVLGAELPASGFDPREFAALALSAVLMLGMSLVARRSAVKA